MSHKRATPPSLDIVYGLQYGVWRATALHAALELNVFTIIANGSHTLGAIAAEAQCDQRGTRILLNAVCSLKLLRKRKGDYFLTPVSESFLVRGKPAYYGEWCLRTQLAFDVRARLADGIRTGRAVGIDASQVDSGELWKGEASTGLYTWPLDAAEARLMWQTLGMSHRAKPSPMILDVACGSGVNSFVLAQADPGARIIALDFPKVLEVTRQVAEAMSVAEQVEFQPGDALTSDFGIDRFDIVLLGKILYYFRVDQVRAMLHRVHLALKGDGLAVISTYIADDRRCTDEKALMAALQLFIFAPQSEVYTYSEYRRLLTDTGLTHVTQHSDKLISASK